MSKKHDKQQAKATGRHRSKATPKIPHKRGVIRIIAGQWRGRKLPVHDIDGLRPTTDRVKETVFNWLMQHIRQANCLDCFAGSGSLGFEALSRGADTVVLVEKNPQAAAQIKQNLDLLSADPDQLVQADCLDYLNTHEKPFDIVFIDPPFRQNLANPVCQLLEQRQLLNPAALIYVEVETELNDFTPPANWQLLKEKTAGQVCFRLYTR